MDNEQKEESSSKVVDDMKKEAKGAAKKVAKHILKIAMPYIIVFIIILSIGAMVFSIFTSVTDLIKNLAQDVVSFFTIGDNGIEITDEQLDKMIENLESLGIDFDDLGLLGEIDYEAEDLQDEIQKTKREYMRMFFEAQVVTQEINRGGSGLQGQVFVYRASGNDTNTSKTPLNYINYEDFMAMVNAGNVYNIKDKFTLQDGKLIVAKTKTVEKTIVTSRDDDILGPSTETSREPNVIEIVPIDYKSLISQYTTPMTFFVTLGITTRNPLFLKDVAELAKNNARIELTVIDTIETEIETQVDKFTLNRKINERYGPHGAYTQERTTSNDIEQTTTTTTTTTTPRLAVTYAKTWICEQTINYTKLPTDSQTNPQENLGNIYNEKEPPAPPLGSSADWKVSTAPSTLDRKFNADVYDNGIASDYIDKTDDFIKLLDIEYNLPNSKEKRTAGAYLKTDAEMLFALLAQNPDTQGMEQVMRYIMYKYTGKDYGVTELDFSIFDPKYFSSSTSISSLSDYLHQFNHGPTSPDGKYYKMYGDSAGWPTIGDADLQWKSHHSEFNVPGKVLKNGVETDVPSIEAYVNGVLGKGAEAKYSNSEISEKQIYVDKEIVDEIGSTQIEASLDAVKAYTSGLNLSKQQLYALVHVYRSRPAYIAGDNINGYTSFKQAYQAAAAKYEINSWEFNRFLWDEWWNYLHGGQPGHIYSRDMEFETFVKGVFDFSQSSAGPAGGRTKYIYYTQAQINSISYAPKKPITRTASNEQEIFTYEERSTSIVEAAYEVADHFMNSGVVVHYAGNSVKEATNNGRYCVGGNIQGAWDYPIQNPSYYGVVCATYVSLSIWRAGLIDEATINRYRYNSCGGVEQMLNDAGSEWQKITNRNELQEGDIVICRTHAWIYIDGNKRLDQNYCVKTSDGRDLRGVLLNGFYEEFKEAYRYVGG